MIPFQVMILLAIGIATALLLNYWKSTFLPKPKASVRMSSQKRVQQMQQNFEAEQKLEDAQLRRKFLGHFDKTPFLGFNRYKYDELCGLLDAIDWNGEGKMEPEDVYFQQLTLSLVFVLLCVLVGFWVRPAFLFVLLTPLVYGYPVQKLKGAVQRETTQILFEFPDFFDVVYSQYSVKNTNILLVDVVESYQSVAGTSFRRMLKRFLIDLEQGEDRALYLLDRRYQNQPVIHKFASTMRKRLRGEEASFVAMYHFREALQTEVKDWMLSDLDKRKQLAARLTSVMVVSILTVVLIIYFLVFVQMSL